MAVKLRGPSGHVVETSDKNVERLLRMGYTMFVETPVVIEPPKRRGRPPKKTEE